MSVSSNRSKFRAPLANNRLLRALFYEETPADKSTCLYSLKDWDHEGFPSLYRLYMETADPTEYRFVQLHLESWEHWEQLCHCLWFKPYIERWRKELDLKIKSESLARIMREAKTTSRDSFTANKYLLEKGWEPKDSSKRGRPSKEEIKQATEEIVRINGRLDDDFKRLGIN